MMEGAVELIGFDDGVVALLRDEAIGLVVIRDTAEEGMAVDVAGAQQVRQERGGRGLAVGTRHAEPTLTACQFA